MTRRTSTLHAVVRLETPIKRRAATSTLTNSARAATLVRQAAVHDKAHQHAIVRPEALQRGRHLAHVGPVCRGSCPAAPDQVGHLSWPVGGDLLSVALRGANRIQKV